MSEAVGADPFEIVIATALALGGVAASTKYDGSPILKLRGSFMAGLATHPSAEPGTLIIRAGQEQRQQFIDDAPEIYYLTDHYRRFPVVLVRLSRVNQDRLRELLSMSRQLTLPKAKGQLSASFTRIHNK